jgi:hypothetical protein
MQVLAVLLAETLFRDVWKMAAVPVLTVTHDEQWET